MLQYSIFWAACNLWYRREVEMAYWGDVTKAELLLPEAWGSSVPLSCPPESNQLPSSVIYHLKISIFSIPTIATLSCLSLSSSGMCLLSSSSRITMVASLSGPPVASPTWLPPTWRLFQTCNSNCDQREHWKMQTRLWNSFKNILFPSKFLIKSRIILQFERSCLFLPLTSAATLVSFRSWNNPYTSFRARGVGVYFPFCLTLTQPLLMNFHLSLRFHPKCHFLSKPLLHATPSRVSSFLLLLLVLPLWSFGAVAVVIMNCLCGYLS